MKILGSETNRPEQRAQAESIQVIKQTLAEVKTLQDDVKAGNASQNDFLVKTSELFAQSVEQLEFVAEKSQLDGKEIIGHVSSVFTEIRQELTKTREAYEAIEINPQITNEITVPDVVVPEITVPTPVANVTVEAPDLTRLEELFTGLPALLVAFVEQLDLLPAEELRGDLKIIKGHLKTIADKEWTANIVGGGFGGGGGTTASVQAELTRTGGTTIAVVNPDGTPITAGGSASLTPLNEFDENALVPPSFESTILLYTVPAATTAKIQGFTGTAGVAARYKLKVGGVTVALIKTSASRPTETINFSSGVISVATGGVVTITGYHGDSSNNEMAATLFGYII